MGLVLGSQELVDAIAKRQKEDPEFRKTMRGLSVNILFAATDCPGNEDRQYAIKIENGEFTGVGVEVEPAPSKLREPSFDKEEFDYKAIGDYKSFSGLLRREIDLLEWIAKVKLEGDFGKSLSQLTRLTGFLDVLSTMDLEL
jgi:hypothetical protein